MTKKILLILLLLHGDNYYSFAQQEHHDSAKFYRDIETLSHKNKVTRFIHKIFFKPVSTPPKPTLKKGKKTKSPARVIPVYYTRFEGKPIRDVIITTLDPFGYKLIDTTVSPRSFMQKTGNTIHIKTQRIAVRNLLLFRKNEPFDSLMVRDSERLIRSQRYVREVVIYAMSAGKKSDSVDIFVRVLDNWSININEGASLTKVVTSVSDRNFLGLGHRFENGYNWQHTSGKTAYQTNYFVPNIDNTFISANLAYLRNEVNTRTTSLDIQRPFYSAFTKWAWGATATAQSYNSAYQSDSSITNIFRFKTITQDYWGGRAYQIFKGREEENRTTNLILSARYNRFHYFSLPDSIYDPRNIYSRTNTYLVSAGISTRKYRQDTYIFNYNLTEDVPVGKAYSITTGFQDKINSRRQYYLGLRVAWGNYYHWGYISTHLEYGTFLNESKTGVFAGEINYFTGLLELGKWKFRQFIKPQITTGFNRTDSLTLTNELGIRGFTAQHIKGSQRLLILLQTQSYAPWNVLGFRFGPYIICALGMLADETNGFNKSKLYAQYGLGVLIKNEYLVLNTFQFSIAFYPLIPGAGYNIFKVNRYRTYYYGFRDFDTTRPSMISYR